MPKLTRIEIIQRALSAIDSDNVTASDETVESEQVLMLLDQVYEKLLAIYPWPHLYAYDTLETTATAHQMRIPADVMGIEWIKYNTNDLIKLTPKEMTDMLQNRDTTQSDVDSNGAVNNKDPLYWTTEDDAIITFDSYNSTLQSNLSIVYVVREPASMTDDTDLPDLPSRFHPILVDGLIEESFRTLTGDNVTARIYEKKFKQGQAQMKRWARIINEDNTTYNPEVNYGRRNIS